MIYGRKPGNLGIHRLDWSEYLRYLYLPIWIPGSVQFAVPERLAFIQPLLETIMEQLDGRSHVYVTATRGYATPGNPLNRPGWHSDGFGSDDINYVWSDRYPTLFAEQPFTDISDDHLVSMQQFEDQVRPECIRTYDDCTLLRLDPSVIHAAPEIPAPGGERGFIKVSLSNSKYNLRGNSHNYLLDYEWQMHDRAALRNDPSYAGGDAGPQ